MDSFDIICSYKTSININNNPDKKPKNMILVNKNELAAYSYADKFIKFFDIANDFKEITTINNIISSCDPNSMCAFDSNTLLVGGIDSSGLYLIDSKKHEHISVIKNIKEINSILKLSNNNILIGCSDENKIYSLIEYKIENNNCIKIKIKEGAHKGDIYGLREMDNGTIISSSADAFIKFWK